MKAIVYNGPRDVEVKEMPDPSIQHPSDVIVKVTTTNICGSDLHMYEGRTDLEPGKIIGHENLGEIVEVGPAVASLKTRRLCLHPFQRRLRILQELRARPDCGLPDAQPRQCRRRLRLCRHGRAAGRSGAVPARALRRLQLPEAARGRPEQAE